MDKLQEIKKYLNNMNPNDENVIAANALLDSIMSETKLYMLYYNGKPLHFTIDSNEGALLAGGFLTEQELKEAL